MLLKTLITYFNLKILKSLPTSITISNFNKYPKFLLKVATPSTNIFKKRLFKEFRSNTVCILHKIDNPLTNRYMERLFNYVSFKYICHRQRT